MTFFNEDEISEIRNLTNQISSMSDESGWFTVTPINLNAVTITFGFTDQKVRITLGTIVISKAEDGEVLCSVRGIDSSSKLPGPDYYPSLAEAINHSRPYFVFMTKRIYEHNHKSWFKRLFGSK